MDGVRLKDMYGLVARASSTAPAVIDRDDGAVLQGAGSRTGGGRRAAPAASTGTLESHRPGQDEAREGPDPAGDRGGGQDLRPEDGGGGGPRAAGRAVPGHPRVRPRPADREALAGQPAGRPLPQRRQADRARRTGPNCSSRTTATRCNPMPPATTPATNPKPPSPPEPGLVADAARKFLKQGRRIASFAPSSRFLARSIMRRHRLRPGQGASSNSGPGPGRSRPSWSAAPSRTRGCSWSSWTRTCAARLRAKFPTADMVQGDACRFDAAPGAGHPGGGPRHLRAAAAVVPGRRCGTRSWPPPPKAWPRTGRSAS